MATLDRRSFLAMLGAGAAAAALPEAAHAARRRKPNIVLILADDLGRHQLGCYGSTFYETPNIDRLASQGMSFTNAYAAAPVCSPTRVSIMTGKYPARVHLTEYIPGNPYPFAKLKQPDWTKHLPVEATTLPEYLAKAGYISGHFGKWHLSVDKEYVAGRPGDPDTQGFSDVLALDKPSGDETAAAGADENYDAHHVREITDRAIAFMTANQDKPFFCYVPHSSIHRPEMEYAPRIVKYATKPEACNESGNNPVLGAMVETLDANIGRLLDAIDALGLSDDTIVIFFSDNGDLYGREGLKPFYGAKADLFEGGVRMPLIVRWPGVVEPGSTSSALMCSTDFLPTFAEIAGVRLRDPEIDGVSIVPALEGETMTERDTVYFHYPHYHALGLGPCGAIREGRFKLIEWFEKSIHGVDTPGALALYDLECDPGERHDLSQKLPDKARDLYQKLAAWRGRVGAQVLTLNPDYDPARAHEKGRE